MRVHLKGIHSVRWRLASGVIATYHYAWRGGPRLIGKPGSPEFLRSYNEAIASRRRPAVGKLFTLIAEFRASSEFSSLSDSTKRAYTAYLRMIEAEFGDMPIEALSDPEVRGEFKRWRDGMADTPRKADYAWTTLARVLSVAHDRGRIPVNPCQRGGRLYEADRAEKIWTEDDIARLLAVGSPSIAMAAFLALWTGQRQGDLLRLPWSGLRRNIHPAAPIKDWSLCHHPREQAPQAYPRWCRSRQHPDSYQCERAPLDLGRVPHIVGQDLLQSRAGR